MIPNTLRVWLCVTVILFASCSADSTQRVSQNVASGQQLDSRNSGSSPAWLDELNRLRKTGGLEPVALLWGCRFIHSLFVI